MKTYILRGKNGNQDISFTVNDLFPVPQRRSYQFEELTRFINYRDYYPDTSNFRPDYDILYAMEQNKGSDFFRIQGTDVIVIPGSSIHPTILTEKDI